MEWCTILYRYSILNHNITKICLYKRMSSKFLNKSFRYEFRVKIYIILDLDNA